MTLEELATYVAFARELEVLLGSESYVRIERPGYMPLSVEKIGPGSWIGGTEIALFHFTTQNGDLMRDPEMTFELAKVRGVQIALPLTYRNDFLGVYQEVLRFDDTGAVRGYSNQLLRQLRDFARTWFRNLRAQGFLPEADAVPKH